MTAHIKSLLHYCKHNTNYYAYASTMPPSRKYVEYKTSLLISLNLRKILKKCFKNTIFKKFIFYMSCICMAAMCVYVPEGQKGQHWILWSWSHRQQL